MTHDESSTLKCPSCGNPLTGHAEGGVSLFACDGGCGGYWFPRATLKRLQDCRPGAGAALLSLPRAEGVRAFRDVQHVCPHCRNTVLYRHCFSRKLDLEIDQCSKCAGFWVDAGRLAAILTADLPEDEKKHRAEDYFEVLIRDKVGRMNLINDDTLDAARQIVQIFRFLCPKAYFPDPTDLSNILM